jgi:PTH2 family peptidyl-tRNA hydrolase
MDSSKTVLEELPEYAMYIFINSDLKMEKGKTASQVGHVVQFLTEEIIRMGYETSGGPPDAYLRYMRWRASGCAKIVLKATQEQLELLLKKPETHYIVDAGRTQIAPNSLTVVGFFPRLKSEMSDIVAGYKLL